MTLIILQAQPAYFPSPLSWLLFFGVALIGGYVIVAITPLRRVGKLNQSDVQVRAIRTVGRVLLLLGLALTLLGLTGIWLPTQLGDIWPGMVNFATTVGLSPLAEMLRVGPFILLGLGVALMPLGWGVLQRQEWGRKSTALLSLGTFFITLALAPPLLLAREIFTGQVVALAAVAAVLLLTTGGAYSVLSTPATRLHFARVWDENV